MPAGLGLLEAWAPPAPGGESRVWRFAAAAGRPAGSGQDGPDAPSMAEVRRRGRYPHVWTADGEDGNRYPVRAEAFVPASPGPDTGHLERRLVDHVAGMLTAALAPDGAALPPRVRLLVEHVAWLLVRDGCQEAWNVRVAAEPDGEPIEHEHHLLLRFRRDRTVRLAMAAVAPEARTPSPDPACLLAGHRGCASLTGEDLDGAVFRTRVACATGLLGEFLCLTNGDRMTFGVIVGRHRLDLPVDPDAADEMFRAWLNTSSVGDRLRDEVDWLEGEGQPVAPESRLKGSALTELLADSEGDTVRGFLDAAGWTAEDGNVDTDDDHLVPWLIRDVVEQWTTRVLGGTDRTPLLAYAVGLPMSGCDADDDASDMNDYGMLVLVGCERVGIITMYAPM
ncbi:hypothetical protein [Embleya sp. MST-111070]|uniref:hypothetical protein n=1 Tax=Embleya sp. MST-111070 TaxID=3398231 RepID=UPI003F73D103